MPADQVTEKFMGPGGCHEDKPQGTGKSERGGRDPEDGFGTACLRQEGEDRGPSPQFHRIEHGFKKTKHESTTTSFQEGGESPVDRNESRKNFVATGAAKKMAFNAALLDMMVLMPLHSLFVQLQDRPDFLEIACSPQSALSQEMTDAGFLAKRVNYKEGYDLASRRGNSMLKQEVALHTPRHSWVSRPCTRLSSLVNLIPRSEIEWATF